MSIDKTIAPIDRMISGIEPVAARPPGPPAAEGGESFVSILRGQMDELVSLQDNAAQMQQKLAAGQIDDLSQVVMAVQKADLALNFALQLRNKVIEAYQEVTRMQV
jgi:flagellar hook-basal body complex protein FliE